MTPCAKQLRVELRNAVQEGTQEAVSAVVWIEVQLTLAPLTPGNIRMEMHVLQTFLRQELDGDQESEGIS